MFLGVELAIGILFVTQVLEAQVFHMTQGCSVMLAKLPGLWWMQAFAATVHLRSRVVHTHLIAALNIRHQ